MLEDIIKCTWKKRNQWDVNVNKILNIFRLDFGALVYHLFRPLYAISHSTTNPIGAKDILDKHIHIFVSGLCHFTLTWHVRFNLICTTLVSTFLSSLLIRNKCAHMRTVDTRWKLRANVCTHRICGADNSIGVYGEMAGGIAIKVSRLHFSLLFRFLFALVRVSR